MYLILRPHALQASIELPGHTVGPNSQGLWLTVGTLGSSFGASFHSALLLTERSHWIRLSDRHLKILKGLCGVSLARATAPVSRRPAGCSPQPHILGAGGPGCADSLGDSCCPGPHPASKEEEGDTVWVRAGDMEREAGTS